MFLSCLVKDFISIKQSSIPTRKLNEFLLPHKIKINQIFMESNTFKFNAIVPIGF